MPKGIVTSTEIGAAIKKRRKELGLSQEQLAEQVGVSYQQIQRYENGNSMLNVENMQRIAQVLRLPLTDIFPASKTLPAATQESSQTPSEEKSLLKHFRQISTGSDKKLAVTIVRKIAGK